MFFIKGELSRLLYTRVSINLMNRFVFLSHSCKEILVLSSLFLLPENHSYKAHSLYFGMLIYQIYGDHLIFGKQAREFKLVLDYWQLCSPLVCELAIINYININLCVACMSDLEIGEEKITGISDWRNAYVDGSMSYAIRE